MQVRVSTGELHAVGAGVVPEGAPGGVLVGVLVGVLEGVPGEAGVVLTSTPAVAVAAAGVGPLEHMGRVADCTPVANHSVTSDCDSCDSTS